MFRGSQYKVESFIFRLAKPESFVLVSPSKQQVGLQNAPFAVPLIAEPESKYYNHPIIVLDFQSLYPSVMIAYNLCYSTCLGRVEKFKGTDKFGFTELKVADGLLELLKDYLTGESGCPEALQLEAHLGSDSKRDGVCQAGSEKEPLSQNAG
jgi:DNA polymerase zeta